MAEIDFRGYSGDCLIHGRLDVPAEVRLTDFLNTTETYPVLGASLFALEDAREVAAGDQELAAEDLWAVEPTDPATSGAHHLPTRAMEVEIYLPPYMVTGFLHGVNTSDPLAGIHRRRRMIPLTEATISFNYAGQELSRDASVLIINRDRAHSVQRVKYEKSKIDDLGIVERNPNAKDYTSDFVLPEEA